MSWREILSYKRDTDDSRKDKIFLSIGNKYLEIRAGVRLLERAKWSPKMPVSFFLGEREHAGQARIEFGRGARRFVNPGGGAEHQHQRRLRINRKLLPKSIPPATLAVARHQIDDSALIVWLPSASTVAKPQREAKDITSAAAEAVALVVQDEQQNGEARSLEHAAAQMDVDAALRKMRLGDRLGYGEIAKRLGSPHTKSTVRRMASRLGLPSTLLPLSTPKPTHEPKAPLRRVGADRNDPATASPEAAAECGSPTDDMVVDTPAEDFSAVHDREERDSDHHPEPVYHLRGDKVSIPQTIYDVIQWCKMQGDDISIKGSWFTVNGNRLSQHDFIYRANRRKLAAGQSPFLLSEPIIPLESNAE